MKSALSLFIFSALLATTAPLLCAQTSESVSDLRWGDLGDGRFANPVINADYSDPDVIRVGDRFYMTCSEFHFMGMPILESTDMVNWHIIGQVYDRIDLPGYSEMAKYAEGTWPRRYGITTENSISSSAHLRKVFL